MCGRFALHVSPEQVREAYGYAAKPNFPPRYNIAPTQPVAIVREEQGKPEFALVRWGLIPPWVKDIRTFPTLINARSEQAAEKPAFRNAIRRRRCLIPADGFYEWQKTPTGKKQPFLIERPDSRVFAFAGLWESWMDAEGNELDSAAILTTQANETLAPIHDRMPVIIEPENYGKWLDADHVPPVELADLMAPARNDFFHAYPVSTRVNAVANDDEGLVAPLAEDTTPPAQPKKKAKDSKAGNGQMSLF